MVATEIGPNLVKASKLIRFTRAVSVFVRQIKVFGKANRPSICWCLRFQHWAGRLKVLFDWEEDNPRLTDDKILWNVGILNKRRRLHSCNKSGQAVRKKTKPNESIFFWTAALGFKSEPEHTDSTLSPFVFLHTTLTCLKSDPWSVPSFSGRRNYFEDAPEKSEDALRSLFTCVGRCLRGTLFPWDGRFLIPYITCCTVPCLPSECS